MRIRNARKACLNRAQNITKPPPCGGVLLYRSVLDGANGGVESKRFNIAQNRAFGNIQFIGKLLRRYPSSIEQSIYDFKKSFGLHKIIFCSFVVQYVLQPFSKSADMQPINEGVVCLN